MATVDLSNSLSIANAVTAEIATASIDVSVSARVVSGEFNVPASTHALAKLLVDTKATLDALKVEEPVEETPIA